MGKSWKNALNRLDEAVGRACLAVLPERPALLVFMFHVLFEDEAAMTLNLVDPQQRITTRIFAQFVAYYLTHGYTFVSPGEVVHGLDPTKKYVLITFDDGYYNNHLALPILRHYGVSATFFISSHHVLTGQAFWWDVVYRERQRQPLTPPAQHAEYAQLKQWRHPEIEQYLLAHFGPTALQPVGDLDRPFTSAELRAFAREPEVFLGNHTAHHAVLTNYLPEAAGRELVACQQHLLEIAGTAPCAVAYPNGNTSTAVVAAAAAAGLRLGVTVRAGKKYLPFARHHVNLLQLNRFLLWGDQDVAAQCARFRIDVRLRNVLRPQRL